MTRAWLILLTVAMVCGLALPQASASGQKTLAATMNVYVFPTTGQTPEVQSQDEVTCYNWAVQNVGTDPFDLSKQAQAQTQQTEQAKQQAAQVGQGAGAAGGAAAGMIRGRRRGRAAQREAEAAAEQQGQQAQAATAEQLANFKKAFSVCLEAKGYMVKF